MARERIYFNGVDALTGDYLQPPLIESEFSEVLRASDQPPVPEHLRKPETTPTPGIAERRPARGIQPDDLASSGWGVIFPQNPPAGVRAALKPLLEHRREQATRIDQSYYRDLEYLSGETAAEFFRRYGVDPGPAHPDQLPYYLLIVGDPVSIPHRFQYLLDVQYAVGRLYFDQPEDYGNYARSVIQAETRQNRTRPEIAFFPVRHDKDLATQRTHERLIEPLVTELGQQWQVRQETNLRRDDLKRFLAAAELPAVLFTSAHGVSFPSGHPQQAKYQGALLCQDSPGPKPGRRIPREHYFSAEDIPADACLHGMVAVLFGCFSAGTPKMDSFPPEPLKNPRECAPRPLVSPLAQKLLSHPNGGALAVLGHVDRTWTGSFGSGRGKGHLHFESMLRDLLDGMPVGAAMDWMNERFAELSTQLSDSLDPRKEAWCEDESVEEPGHHQLEKLWARNHDARNFVVLGDPAVRIPAVRRATPQAKTAEPVSAQPLGSTSRRIAWPRSRASRSEVPRVSPTDDADLTIRVVSDRQSGSRAIRFEVSARNKDLDLNDTSFGPVKIGEDPRRHIEPFFAELRSLSPQDPKSAQEAEARIAASGSQLARDLLPADLRSLLEVLYRRKQASTLLIQSKEDWIPWELLKLEVGPFLCEAFCLSRWQGEVGFKGRLHLPLRSMAFLSPQDAGLPAASVERNEVGALLRGAHRSKQDVDSTYNSVVSALGSGKFDAWHFAGHGLAESSQPHFWTIDLGQGSRLHPKDLSGEAAGFGKTRPLVFFNGCFTGQVGESLSRAGGWAAQWMTLGAGAFIGTSWAVRDASAAAFARAFYDAFLGGASFAEAVRAARLKIRSQFPGDPTWLTYVAYGHPCARCAAKPLAIRKYLVGFVVMVLLAVLSVSGVRGWQHRKFVEHNDRGVELWQQGHRQGAVAAFQSALKFETSATAHASLGQIYAEQNRWPEALASLDVAIELNASEASYHFNRGSILLQTQRPQEAVAAMQRALEIDPKHVEALNNLGLAYLQLGLYEEARLQLEKALTVIEGGVALPANTVGVLRKNLAQAYLEVGSPTESVRLLRLASSQLDPGNTTARRQVAVLLARSHAELGQSREACTVLRQQFLILDLALISPQALPARELASRMECPLIGETE